MSKADSRPGYVFPDVFNDPDRDAFLYGTFPDDFAWSSATSSYQIEGAWNEDGKGLCNWDTFSHTQGKVKNGDTGDIACDSYHKYKEDVALMKAMGLRYYRFSISWPRILPDGTLNHVNEAGVAYYNNLIDELRLNDITPMITLFHWDTPQTLEDHGGWDNEDIIDRFNDYAEICFKRFGDRVHLWITFNEPWITSVKGYGTGEFAPGIEEIGSKVYRVSHNIIKAHAKAWHTYDDKYRKVQGGKVGITLNGDFAEPFDRSNKTHVEAAETYLQFNFGWFAHPIFVNGDYPEIMKRKIAAKSVAQCLSTSRLPEFSEDDKAFIKGTSDFFGLNAYTTQYVTDATDGGSSHPPSYWNDPDVKTWQDEAWPKAGSVWLRVVPWGLRRLLKWVNDRYHAPIYITENGVSTSDVFELDDQLRQKFYRAYINEALKAVKLDGVDLRGYTAWSLLDNFEWASGYSERFGMHYVDFNDPQRPRTAKKSASLYSRIVKDNGFKQ